MKIYFALCALGLACATLAQAEPRHALLMGAWEYEDPIFAALPQSAIDTDLKLMSQRLSAVGFKVTVVRNPTLKQAKQSVDDFGELIKSGTGVGLFYFSGHGSEYDGKNFLIPIGTTVKQNRDLDDEALSANRVIARMEESGARVNIMFLDCCRNSLSKAGGNGMAAMEAKGTFIGYATSSQKISQASAEGSFYTTALANHLATPGLSIGDMHTMVTRDVTLRDSGQVPFQYSGLDSIFYFAPNAGAAQMSAQPAPVVETPPPPPPPEAPLARSSFISSVTASSTLAPMRTKSEGTITYEPARGFDGDLETAWVDGVDGVGIGEWLKVSFSQPVRAKTIRVFGGYGKNADIFGKNARPRALKLTTDGGATFTLRFEDVRGFSSFALPEEIVVRWLRFEIIDAYRGSKYDDTAISEIRFE